MHRTSSYLPIYLPHSGLNINDWHVPPQPRPGEEKCVHVIPVIVLLCFLILWWFSCPVNVELKDGRIAAIHQIEDMPLSLNDTHVELAVLASAMSPIASTPKNFTRDNETESTPGEEK